MNEEFLKIAKFKPTPKNVKKILELSNLMGKKQKGSLKIALEQDCMKGEKMIKAQIRSNYESNFNVN